MSELQRYEMNHKGLPEFDDKGVWVLQEEHCAAVAKLEARVKAAEDVADKYLHEAKRHQRALLAAEEELERLKTQDPVAYRWEGKSSGNICYDGIKPLGVIGQPLYTEPRPAVLEKDIENILQLLADGEWAEHCTKSSLGKKLEEAITELHNEISGGEIAE